jgi:pimeloyl-ACP methyl ester carboxylesterase
VTAYLSPDDWLNQGQMLSVLGHSIFLRDSGKDLPPMLLLHGFPTSSWDWYKVWPLLDSHYRLIAPDFLGFGFSGKPFPFPYSISHQADLVEEIVSQLSISGCCIVAHDYAVSVVQELLWRRLNPSQRPSTQFEIVFLLNGGLFPETHRARPIQKLLLGRWGRWVNLFLTKRSLRKNLHQVFGPNTRPAPEEIDAFWQLINYHQGKRCFHLLIRYMKDRVENRDNWVDALIKTRTPLILINGPEDPVSGIHMVHRYRQLVPNPIVHILDGIGHYPNVEAPEQVASWILHYASQSLSTGS